MPRSLTGCWVEEPACGRLLANGIPLLIPYSICPVPMPKKLRMKLPEPDKKAEAFPQIRESMHGRRRDLQMRLFLSAFPSPACPSTSIYLHCDQTRNAIKRGTDPISHQNRRVGDGLRARLPTRGSHQKTRRNQRKPGRFRDRNDLQIRSLDPRPGNPHGHGLACFHRKRIGHLPKARLLAANRSQQSGPPPLHGDEGVNFP
jgi:hypothetical protein